MAKKRKPKNKTTKKKEVNYMIIVLSVLLAISILYIAFPGDISCENQDLNESYQKGFGDGQIEVLSTIANETSTRGYINIVDINTNSMITLVRYNSPTE